MSLEKSITEIVEGKLKDGTIEAAIGNAISDSIESSLKGIFGYNGAGKKLLDEKLTSIIVPAISNYNFDEYIIKLDTVLTEIVNTTDVSENKKLLNNFKDLMIGEDIKEIKLSEIFKRYCKFVEKNVDTDGLKVEFDDEPAFESVEVELNVENIEAKVRYLDDKKVIYLTCDHDENMNVQFEIRECSWKKGFQMCSRDSIDLNSLRYINEMEVFVAKLARTSTEIIVDIEYNSEYVTPEEEPEASY